MSAAARARIIALVEAVVPTVEPRTRFRCAASGRGGGTVPIANAPSVSRRFELVTLAEQRDAGVCHATGAGVLYAATWGIRIGYAAAQGQDAEAVTRMVESDERDIVGALMSGWESDLEMVICRGGAQVQQSATGPTVTIPVEVLYYP